MKTCDRCGMNYILAARIGREVPACACLEDLNRTQADEERRKSQLIQVEAMMAKLQMGTWSVYDRQKPDVVGWDVPKVPVSAGRNLAVTGEVGTRKTTLLKQVGFHAAMDGVRVRGGFVAKMMARFKDFDHIQEYQHWLESGDLLILDDIDKMFATQFEVQRLFMLVDHYRSYERSIVFSMNSTADELLSKLAEIRGVDLRKEAEAILSRLMGGAQLELRKGNDLRFRPKTR